MLKNKITQVLIMSLTVLISFLIQWNAFKSFVPVLSSDNAIYTILAERFHNGNYNEALHIWWQPLFPFAGSLLMIIGLSGPDGLFYISLLSGVLLFIPVFFLTKIITKSLFYGLLAGTLASFNSKLISSYFQLLTENIYILFFTTAILFSYLFLSERKLIFIIFAGIFYGMGYLTRADILLAMQIFAVSSLVLLASGKIKFKRFLLAMAILGVVFISVISPYLYFNFQKFGYLNLSAKLNASLWMPAYFAPQNNMTTTYSQEVWSVDTPNYDSRYFNEKFDFWKYKQNIYDDTKTRLRIYAKIMMENNKPFEITLFLIGYVLSIIYFWKKNKAGSFLTALLPLNFFAAVPFHPGTDIRYLFWAYPLFIFFSVLGLFILSQLAAYFLKKTTFNSLTPIFLLMFNILLVIVFLNLNKGNLSIPVNTDPSADAFKIIGNYIRDISEAGKQPRIMYRREALGYYSGGMLIYIPTSIGDKELREYAKLWNADYLLADRFTFAPETPLGYLVDETKAPSFLKAIKTWEGNITKTVLYKFEL